MKNKAEFRNERNKLLRMAKNCNILDTNEVSKWIDTLKKENEEPIKESYQKTLYETYQRFCNYNQIPFDIPKIKPKYPIPLIPTTVNVEKIISVTSQKYATIFRIMTETAAEGEELHITHRNAIDAEQGTISITGTKGHANKVYKLKSATAQMLRIYLAHNTSNYPFPTSRAISAAWQKYRKRASQKLCEPDLMKIPCKNLRNYSGAIFYNTKGKDTIETMRHMRHKKLDTTQHYLNGIVTNDNGEWIHKTVELGTPNTIKQIEELADEGYQFFADADGYKIFRKPK